MSLTEGQAALPRAITVRASVANMRQRVGPQVQHYNFPLDRGRTFRFVEGSILVDDGVTVIGTNGSGKSGRWLLVREPDKGDDIPDAAATTINVSGGFYRRIPLLGQTTIVTLGVVNAEEGDVFELTRIDASAFTLAILNGGPGVGTLVTFPVSLQGSGIFYFDGTNWEKKHAATMLV